MKENQVCQLQVFKTEFFIPKFSKEREANPVQSTGKPKVTKRASKTTAADDDDDEEDEAHKSKPGDKADASKYKNSNYQSHDKYCQNCYLEN